MTSNDYPHIRAWGRMIGSYDYYIKHQVELARDEQAPADAIYRRDDGTWATTDEILRSDTRRQLGLEPLPFQEPEPSTLLPPLRQVSGVLTKMLSRVRMNVLSCRAPIASVTDRLGSRGWQGLHADCCGVTGLLAGCYLSPMRT